MASTIPAMNPALKPGITFSFEYVVGANKTVPQLYPEWKEFGEMPEVFATGFLVGLLEGVCQLAIKPYLDWPREQSVGTQVNFSHLAATPPGLTVRVACEVIEVDGRRVRFRASAHDGHDLISEGTHERVVIDAEKFNRKLQQKIDAGRASGTGAAVASPCVSICRMDPRTALCEGCLRTIDEIAQWSSLSDDSKRAILAQLPARAGAR
ncbi:MAG: thioesterase, FlK family [Burkholderiaceae bacterium]